MKPVNMEYHGLTHLPVPEFLYGLWKRFLCRRNIHLLDEVMGTGSDPVTGSDWNHYLVCDACQLMVGIKSIDLKYVKGSPQTNRIA